MKIYTDGATSNNGYNNAIGGWAYVIINDNGEKISEDSGRIPGATNNICEMTAIIKACHAALPYWGTHTIYSDSAYCIRCKNEKWYDNWRKNGWINSQKKPVANKELWEELIPFFESPLFEFEKIKGHSGNKWNEYVDKLAVKAKGVYNG